MTLSDLGNIGEFVGGILVVASLFYLASQVRQNTRAMRVAAFQDAVRSASTWASLLVQDPCLGPLVERGVQDLAGLSETERSQVIAFVGMVMRDYSAVLVLERDGFLSAGDISAAYEEYLRETLASPSMREWWGENKRFYAPSGHESIERLLAV